MKSWSLQTEAQMEFYAFMEDDCEEEDSFVLDLTRASLLEDTFEQLAEVDHMDYQRPLKVCSFDLTITWPKTLKLINTLNTCLLLMCYG